MKIFYPFCYNDLALIAPLLSRNFRLKRACSPYKGDVFFVNVQFVNLGSLNVEIVSDFEFRLSVFSLLSTPSRTESIKNNKNMQNKANFRDVK